MDKEIFKELFELIKLNKEKVDTMYKDVKSDISTIIVYLVSKSIINADDFFKFAEEEKKLALQAISEIEQDIKEGNKDEEE